MKHPVIQTDFDKLAKVYLDMGQYADQQKVNHRRTRTATGALFPVGLSLGKKEEVKDAQ